MNEVFESKLKILASDKITLDAIKAIFLEKFEKEKPNVLPQDDDTVLGQKYRAYEKAISIFDEVLEGIETYKDNKTNTEDFNKGR